MSSLRVSVVVVNWNTSSLLRACLASVDRASEGCPLECIVVDNGSSDGSPEMVESEFPEARLIRNEDNVGFARANNQAFEVARGDYVLLLNSDATILEDGLRASIEYADEHPRTGVVGGRQSAPDGRVLSAGMRFPRLRGIALAASGLPVLFSGSPVLNWEHYGADRWETPRAVDFVMGSFLLIRRHLLDEIGTLDPRFFVYGEEADLCYRAHRAEYLVEQLPMLVVRHSIGGSSQATQISGWVHEAKQRGILLFVHKWHGLPSAWIANVIMLTGLLPRALLWIPADLFARARGRTHSFRRIAKLRIFRFHVAATFQPRRLTRTIDPPPVAKRPVSRKIVAESGVRENGDGTFRGQRPEEAKIP